MNAQNPMLAPIRIAGAFLMAAALLSMGCEDDTSGLGDGTVESDSSLDAGRPDSAANDASMPPDAGPPDTGILPEVWAVEPCPPSVTHLESPLMAGGGPLAGVLTVFVGRYPWDAPLAGSRVRLQKAERTLEGTTDDRGCIRFVGQGLVGPVEITATADDYTMVLVRGLGSAQLESGIQSRASLSETIELPPLGEATVAGTVTGFERFPSVTSTGTESRRILARVEAVYRRDVPPFLPQDTRRAAPHDALWANIAYVGKLDRGVSPSVDLRDFEKPVFSDYFVGLQVDAEHEIDWTDGRYTRVSPYVGIKLGLAVEADGRLEGEVVDLQIPMTRSFEVELPERPSWATRDDANSSLYLPASDALAFPVAPIRPNEPRLRPAFEGPLASAEELVAFSASGPVPSSDLATQSMAVYLRTRESRATAPAFPARPEINVVGRQLSVSFSEPRDGARINTSLRSATGVFQLIDLGNDQNVQVDIPSAEETLAVPELSASVFFSVSWHRTSDASEVRIANDGVELRARYYKGGDVTLAP